MAITYKDTYTFQSEASFVHQPHFELTALQVEKQCTIHENEVSDYFKIYFIEEGEGIYEIDFKEYKIDGSGIFCLSPGQIFSITSESVKRAFQISFDKDFYCVETHGKEIACNGLLFNNVHRATVISLTNEQTPIFKSLIDQLILEFKHKGNAHQEMLESYLRMFLIQALRMIDKQEIESSTLPTRQDKLAQSFIALVEKQFRKEHTVGAYAEQLFISPKSLAKKLHAIGYPTPSQIIKDRIILEAKRMLKYGEQSIKEIAYSLGFEDPGYFSRLFSKAVKLSPIEYRKN